MLIWDDSLRADVDRAIRQARRGEPTLLAVIGPAGTGKTSLLDQVLRQAKDFRVLSTEGLESEDAPRPLAALAPWGIGGATASADSSGGDTGSAADGVDHSAVTAMFLAVQRLRELLDERRGPTLLIVDDAHRIDPESLEVLARLLSRAAGDPLLVTVAARPSDAQAPAGTAHSRAWSRLLASSDAPIRLTLHGLSKEQARVLVAARRPGLPVAAADRLWEHTSGSPLYLTAMLDEFDAESLALAHTLLPAPTAFADILGHRVTRLEPSARVMLEALAVYGSGWATVADVAAVARTPVPIGAVDELVSAGLVVARADPLPRIRVAHALIRASVYHGTPLALRQVLHRRAAEITTPPSALDHRLAAVDSHDDALADDVTSWAARLHDDRQHRLAAHYYGAAADVTADRDRRERLQLEARWDRALGGEDGAPAWSSGSTSGVVDRPRAAVTAAFTLLRLGDARGALRTLDELHGPELRRCEAVVRYRVAMVRAYLLMLLGEPTAEVLAALGTADAAGAIDAALLPIASPTRGYMAARTTGASVITLLRVLPDDANQTPPDQISLVVWRGLYRVTALDIPGALADFEALVGFAGRRGDSVSHQVHLGLTRWLAGDWPLAKIAFDLGVDALLGSSSWLPEFESTLMASGQGRFEAADAALDAAVERSRAMPFPENRLMLLVALVVRCHAEGLPAAQIELLATDFADLAALLDYTAPVDSLMLMHAAQAALWIGRTDLADRCVATMRAAEVVGQSHAVVMTWLDGLIARHRGDQVEAERLLGLAARDERNDLPFYRAHMWADHAAAAAALGDRADAARSRGSALSGYRKLGAAPYVERLEAAGVTAPATQDAAAAHRPLITEREQDVLALLVNGLSYAQIARSLFVTQSTVGFHLSRLYAKFGVASRHELTAVVRRDPGLLHTLAVTG